MFIDLNKDGEFMKKIILALILAVLLLCIVIISSCKIWDVEILRELSRGNNDNKCYVCVNFDVWKTAIPATCTTAGEETRTCIDCNTTETKIVVYGHIMGEWIETTAPTTTEEGEETKNCQRVDCSYYETRHVAPVLSGTVFIIGTAQVGETLMADTADLGGSGNIYYQWKRGAIIIGTSNTYTVQTADAGSTIIVTVTRSENSGSVSINPTAAVTVPVTFSITFSQLENIAPDITGPNLRLIGGATETMSILTVANPAQYENDSIKWYFNGNQITGVFVSGSFGENLLLSSVTYSNIGTYFITLEVSKDGRRYSKAISFTVGL